MELFWATLTFILALKKLLGGSLGAASGSLTAHNHPIDSMDRDFGALEDLLETLLGRLLVSQGPPEPPNPMPRALSERFFFDFELSTSHFQLSK